MKSKNLTIVTIVLCTLVLSLFALTSISTAQEIGKGPGRSVEHWPTGLTVYDPTRAYPGFTIFTSLGGDGTHYLIDMKGKVVHTWKVPQSHYGWLLPNGNLYTGFSRLDRGLGTAATGTPAVANVGVVAEVDWDSKIVRKWENDAIHHDYDKLPNGNTLTIIWTKLEKPKEMKGGIPGTEYPGGVILGETIVEINQRNEIVWKWEMEDLDPDEYPVCPLCYRQRSLHTNSIQYLPPDNPIFPGKELIILSNRQPSAGIIVDKETKKVLWRYGGYKDGEWARLGHQHSFYMIGGKIGADYKGKALPGYGNILVFDNGMHVAGYADWGLPRSSVTEIDPKTKKVVWSYKHTDTDFKGWMPPEWMFNSPYIAGAQRLPNGNTLIAEGGTGRIFEVTKAREIVWEFINPEKKAVFRAYRYGPDFPGFAGKNLPRP